MKVVTSPSNKLILSHISARYPGLFNLPPGAQLLVVEDGDNPEDSEAYGLLTHPFDFSSSVKIPGELSSSYPDYVHPGAIWLSLAKPLDDDLESAIHEFCDYKGHSLEVATQSRLSDDTEESSLRVRVLWWYYMFITPEEREVLLFYYTPLIAEGRDEGQWPKENILVISAISSAQSNNVAYRKYPPLADPLTPVDYTRGHDLLMTLFSDWASDFGHNLAVESDGGMQGEEMALVRIANSIKAYLPVPKEYPRELERLYKKHVGDRNWRKLSKNYGIASADGTSRGEDGTPSIQRFLRSLFKK